MNKTDNRSRVANSYRCENNKDANWNDKMSCARRVNVYLKLIRFDKPIGALLLLWPTLMAIMLSSNGRPQRSVLAVFILGVFLTRSAGCAINDYADSEFDKKVERTKNRPLASNAISKKEAFSAAAILSVSAFLLAVCFLRSSAILMCFPALFLFILYPFTKRFFIYPQLILSVAFSFGILMAFVQNVGHITASGWILFFANLCWVFGYDTIYALVDIEDDLKIGIKTSAISLGKFVVKAIAIAYVLFIFLMVVLGFISNLNDLYWVGVVLAAALLVIQVKVLMDKKADKYFNLFLLNNWVGLILFISMWFSLDLFTK